MRCPAICRDAIKEGFLNTLGQAGNLDDAVSRHAYETFFDVVKFLLSHRITLVAEAAFQHKLWAPKLEPLRAIARIRIILCEVDPRLAGSRRLQRLAADPKRALFHDERSLQAALDSGDALVDSYDPPHLDLPTLSVDTSNEYQPALDAIVSFALA